MKKTYSIVILLSILAIFFRIYHIEFGLPQSFHADEAEIGEYAIKYTYEIRNIISNKDYYKLIPVSFVYGTFPIYTLTFLTMVFSKILGILNISFTKADIYIYMRIVNLFVSILVIPPTTFLYYKMYKSKFGMLTVLLLTALNWKLIVHSHYLNSDAFLTTLMSLAYLTAYLYFRKGNTLHVVLLGIIFGLAAGTKITSLISLPLFTLLFGSKKDIRGLLAFLFIIFAIFSITNPFSVILPGKFLSRVFELKSKEAGLVFDSIDLNPLKYIFALTFISTPLILLTSLYGKIISLKISEKENTVFHYFLIGNVLIYIIFYSLGARRVDRWLLPILPIVLIYASFGFHNLISKIQKPYMQIALLVLTLITYSYFPVLLLFQFKKDTPRTAAYAWMKENVNSLSTKFIYTELGLDPMNKLTNSTVFLAKLYVTEGAQFVFPPSPKCFEYVITYSRAMEIFKNPEVKKRFPAYSQKWKAFESTLKDETAFKQIKSFTLPKPNIIPLSDVYVFKNLEKAISNCPAIDSL